jgi:fatty acid desaturase
VAGMRVFFRQADNPWPHLWAIAYAIPGYAVALIALTMDAWWLNAPGVVLLTHTLVIGAYLVHECAHNTIFKSNAHNATLGKFLNWINGACYGRYEDIRHKHFRHHVDRADVVAFDFRPRLEHHHPKFLKLIQYLEWAYIPAVDLMMHALVLVLPFILPQRHDRRARIIVILAIRTALFTLLAWISIKALLLYALSYLLFLHVMRFMDVHQHTYVIFETLEQKRGDEAKRYDVAFENRNTFSNLISVKHPWLNLLTLNFGYHNAHHVKPTTPWFQLPALHQELYGNTCTQWLPFRKLLASYHRHRVARIINGDEPDMDISDTPNYIGVVGVSFLTAH